MAAVRAKVLENGHVELPAEHCAELGLKQGDEVVVRVEDGEIRIRTVMESIKSMQEGMRRLLAGKSATVDEFLAERRADAGRE